LTRSNRLLKDALWTLALFGLVAAVMRLAYGLGPTTNLTDAAPWGLWKVLNMVAGVALATSGFTVGFLVYVLRREQYRPLLKAAILAAFLGYGSSCFALLFDIGLPDRFWHPLVMWNEHSFLFEVFWCVLLYFSVTAIELLPTVLERFRTERAVRWLHRIAFGVVVVGISLSSLHHSSLGSLFLVSPQRLHGLWYSPWLPLFFILSAMGAGMMCLVLLRILHAYWYDPQAVWGVRALQDGPLTCSLDGSHAPRPPANGPELPRLRGLATIGAGILTLYLVLKIVDLLRGGGWRLLLAGSWESWLYTVELVLTAVLPLVLLSWPRSRRSPTGLGLAAGSATLGLVLNRLDVGIIGYWRDAQTVYWPSLTEWALSLGVVAAAGLVFLAATEQLPIFAGRPDSPAPGRRRDPRDAFSRVWNAALASGLYRVTLIAVIVLPLGWVLMYPPYRSVASEPVQPPVGLDLRRTELRIDGDRAGLLVNFPHQEHQKRLGGDTSCGICHHVSLPHDRSTPCSRCHRAMLQPTDLFDHSRHLRAVAVAEGLHGLQPENRTCARCHEPGRPESPATAGACFGCHEKDMWLEIRPDPELRLASASGYMDAMHGTCLVCHRREEARGVREALADCGTCHPTLRKRELQLAGR
jgi:Ni/Fe-hydrogenase subunit HybB-like protein